MDNKAFGDRLIALRREKRIKKKDIAAYVAQRQSKRFTERAYQSYESGYRYPGADTLILLAELFGVSVDYLCGRTEDRTKYTPAHDRTSYGERAFELRKARHMTQNDVAMVQGKQSGSGPRISLQEQGKHMPRCAVLVLMADYFNVSIDYLLGITDTRRRHPGCA